MAHPDIYEEFIVWSASPFMEKRKIGIVDQADFAKTYGINKDTLTRWKQRRDFRPRVTSLLQQWARGRTSEVINAMYVAALKGHPGSAKLWLETFENFNSRGSKKKEEKTSEIVFHPLDIRWLIETLPKDQQMKHYYNIRDLLDEVSAVRKTVGPNDPFWNAEVPKDWEEFDKRIPPDPASFV